MPKAEKNLIGRFPGTLERISTMRILQTNLCRGRAAHDLAYATARHMDIDIIMAGEPNKNIIKSNDWIKDHKCDVAFYFLNKKTEVIKVNTFDGWIYLKLRHFAIYGCYISPNIPQEQFQRKVDHIMNHLNQNKVDAILMGDINSKSVQWGSPINDRRGEYWTEWMSRLNLVVHNSGDTPTFHRGNSKSFIDVTCSTQRMVRMITAWEVLPIENLADHAYIAFKVNCGTDRRKKPAAEKEAYLYD
ncbi:endonuclease/exonuclease/phosphatase superfamily [Holotrichia oblita]|uniref:Endonuclease/exonuclease/phosphatase superfamily n=1 Tax=Holotrichia oblita TaxID=644536 RepID=A0ACB9SKH4_HOLOL|nr:endonuclease/exonuclease/phosphatase superfamily [Holotrichia oblita]